MLLSEMIRDLYSKVSITSSGITSLPSAPPKCLLSGENSFNTILIAKITTDVADPVSIEYYEVI